LERDREILFGEERESKEATWDRESKTTQTYMGDRFTWLIVFSVP
jgi:hypothetical protein